MGYRDPVEITIGGNVWKWLLDFRARKTFQKMSGVTVESFLRQTVSEDTTESWEHFQMILFAGIARNHPDITMDDIENALPFNPKKELTFVLEQLMDELEIARTIQGDVPDSPLESETPQNQAGTVGDGSGLSDDSG